MRSPEEIRFRLRQELGNVAMFLLPPRPVTANAPRSLLLPDPAAVADALRGTAYAAEVEGIADAILGHRFPILGLIIDTEDTIDWRRDYLLGVSTGTPYFRRSPYLDFRRVGDHKVIWELNRHQHLPLLGQAFLLTGRRAYLDEAFRQIESWLDANPFLRGINWASALEVAFRALSWAWLWHFTGGEMPQKLRSRFLTALERHGRFLELNLSIYFSPNTHLLGEAVALHALGVLFPEFPGAVRWAETGGRIVEQQMLRQVRDDGTHFEQSAYYHVYALDFFLLYRVLGKPPAAYDERLASMAVYLDALLGVSGKLPMMGDDDGGRLFHPYGERAEFGCATMATCALVLGRPEWLRGPEFLCEQAAWWLGAEALSWGAARDAAEVAGGRVHAEAPDTTFELTPFAAGTAEEGTGNLVRRMAPAIAPSAADLSGGPVHAAVRDPAREVAPRAEGTADEGTGNLASGMASEIAPGAAEIARDPARAVAPDAAPSASRTADERTGSLATRMAPGMAPSAAWPRVSQWFGGGGTAVMAARDIQLVVKAGPFGEGSGGHSHSDVLSIAARLGSREILIDPGTFTYVADPEERNRFRGSAAHNTLRIDGRDQAVPAGPFRWNDKPAVDVREWTTGAEEDYLDATCRYSGFTHRRRVLFVKPASKSAMAIVLDTVEGPPGDHLIEQYWHLGAPEDAGRLSFSQAADTIDSWRSRALCSREPATVLRVTLSGPLPAVLATVLDLSGSPVDGALEIRTEVGANSEGQIVVGRSPWPATGPLARFPR